MYRFTDWYEYIKDMTPESVIVPVPVRIAKQLELILSDLRTPLILDGPIDEVMEFLGNMFDLDELVGEINDAIRRVGGEAFIRWNNAYPKDMCYYIDHPDVRRVPGTMDNVCLFKSAAPFLWASFNSMRIVSITAKEPGSLTPVIVRKPVNLKYEVRVFIERARPIAAVQYYYDEKYDVKDMRKYMLAATAYALTAYFMLPHHSATIDVGVDMDKKKFVVIEVNPPLSSGKTDRIYDGINMDKLTKDNVVLLAWKNGNKWIEERVPVSEIGEQ